MFACFFSFSFFVFFLCVCVCVFCVSFSSLLYRHGEIKFYILCAQLSIYATADEADAYMFYRCFFAFSVRHKNTRQPFSGTAEQIFVKLLPNDSGENGVCIAIPKWGLGPRLIFWGLKTTHCAIAQLVVTPGE